jgi:hypothetical protein
MPPSVTPGVDGRLSVNATLVIADAVRVVQRDRDRRLAAAGIGVESAAGSRG